jgi:hypothetical protein
MITGYDPRLLNPGGFPFDAFEFDNPDLDAIPEIRVKTPWNFHIEGDLIVDGTLDFPPGFKQGHDIYYAGSDDIRIRPGLCDVYGTRYYRSAEYSFTGESGWSAAWQFVTLQADGTITLRSATGAITARPSDAVFQYSGFDAANNCYTYATGERIIGAIWRAGATNWRIINMGTGIEEQGNNDRGHWRIHSAGRFELEQWGNDVANCAATTAFGVLYRSTSIAVNWPVPFAQIPVEFICTPYDLNSVATTRNTSSESTTRGSIVFITAASSAATDRAYNWHAYGKWRDTL